MTITNERLRDIIAFNTPAEVWGIGPLHAAELLAARERIDDLLACDGPIEQAKAAENSAWMERDAARAEVERLKSELADIRGRDALPFDWDGVPTMQEWIEENLPEREPRAGSAMVEIHPDEVVADRGESRRVAGWLKDALAEVERLKAENWKLRVAINTEVTDEGFRYDTVVADMIRERDEANKRAASESYDHRATADLLIEKQAEVERLRAELATFAEVCKILGADADSVEAQAALAMEALRSPNAAVERLRGLMRATAKATGAEIDSLKSELADLRAYRDRNEAALVELSGMLSKPSAIMVINGICETMRGVLAKLGLARDAKGEARG